MIIPNFSDYDFLDRHLRDLIGSRHVAAGVTENKYSLKISTPPVLISWEISTPTYFPGNIYSPREKSTPQARTKGWKRKE